MHMAASSDGVSKRKPVGAVSVCSATVEGKVRAKEIHFISDSAPKTQWTVQLKIVMAGGKEMEEGREAG